MKELAIVGRVNVHRNFRVHGYAFNVDAYICADLLHEGKSCISFVDYDIKRLSFSIKTWRNNISNILQIYSKRTKYRQFELFYIFVHYSN